MSKTAKKVLGILSWLIVTAVILVSVFNENKIITKSSAIYIAVNDLGANPYDITGTGADFEKAGNTSVYKVFIETHSMSYSYDIDASTGEILSFGSEAKE